MKKCPYCAEEIQDEAIICRFCNRELPKQSKDIKAATPTDVLKGRRKKPWLAVLLNCFLLIMGLGYIYLGLWVRFIIVFGLQLFTLLPMTMLGLRQYNEYLLGVIWLFTLVDAFVQAKKINEKRMQAA